MNERHGNERAPFATEGEEGEEHEVAPRVGFVSAAALGQCPNQPIT